MLKLTLRGLWMHRVRFVLTGVAVVIGVAFMAGTMVLTDTMQTTFDGVFASAGKGTDVVVRSDSAVKGEVSDARARVDSDVVGRVATVDGVGSARGSVEAITQLVKADGTLTKTEGLDVAVGANWLGAAPLNPFSLTSGRAPNGTDQVVIDRRTASREKWSIGTNVRVLTKAGPATLSVVGIARFGSLDGRPGSSLVATDDATAQRLFAEPGRFDKVLVAASPGLKPAELTARISSSVAPAGSGLEVVDGTQGSADRQRGLKTQLRFFNQFLLMFAYIALFVGAFIVYNTFSIVAAQRVREFAALRAIGARRRQVLGAVVVEALVVGTVAAVVGITAGIGLAFALRAVVGSGGFDVPSGPMVVSLAPIVTAFTVGVVVTVVSAVAPAARASRVRPLAALRDVAAERTRPSTRRLVTGLMLAALGAAAFAVGITGHALGTIAVGALALTAGTCALAPVLVRPAVAVLRLPFAAAGVTGTYAAENVRRNPRRTAATASALMIGVALVGFITILASSTKASVAAFVDRSFRADYVIDSGSSSQGFSTTVEHDIGAIRGVVAVVPQRLAPAEVNGTAAPVIGLDTAKIDDVYDLGVTSGSMSAVDDHSVAIAANTAKGAHIHVGDTVPVRFADGTSETLTVRALFDSNSVGGDAEWIIGLRTFEAHVADQFDRRLFVTFAPGVRTTSSRAALAQALNAWPNASVQDRAEFTAAISAK